MGNAAREKQNVYLLRQLGLTLFLLLRQLVQAFFLPLVGRRVVITILLLLLHLNFSRADVFLRFERVALKCLIVIHLTGLFGVPRSKVL